MTKRSLVFISHIKDEKIIALKIQELIKNNFQNQVDIFVSSDKSSIKAGKDWLPQIKNALHDSLLILVLCSGKSVESKWICFETGAGWIMKKRVIPICYLGMRKGSLPSPFSTIQARDLDDREDMQNVFDSIAEECRINPVLIDDFDWSTLTDKIVEKKPAINTRKFVLDFIEILGIDMISRSRNLVNERNDLFRLKKSQAMDLLDLVGEISGYGLGKNDMVIKEIIQEDDCIGYNPYTFIDIVISKRVRNELEKLLD